MINKYSNIPLYSQLKNIIIQKIESGEYPSDSKIPSEQELCEQYGISRPTVRQAINELTNNGYLYKEKGKGTFVAKAKFKIDIGNYNGFTDSILDSDDPGRRTILSINTIQINDNASLAKVFEGNAGMHSTEMAEIKYHTTYGDSTLSFNISYIPLAFFPNIVDDIKDNKPSYEILKGKYPFLPFKSKSSLEVVYTDQSEAQYIQAQAGQPLIKVENRIYSKNGQLVEYIIAKYRADKCILNFENTK